MAAEEATGVTGGDAEDADEEFAELYERLARPFDVISTVAALLGLTPIATSQFVGSATARSPEAARLIATMPATVRALATSVQSRNERCVGELRGPVLWSATMSARASSFGDEGLFVCATPSRAYDVEENQVLVAALHSIARGARDASNHMKAPVADLLLDLTRQAGSEASRWLDHPTIADIPRQRAGARAIRRTRSGKHRRTYEPALAMLARAADPVTAAEVAPWRDQRTRAQHHVLIGVVRRLEREGRQLPPFRVERGSLFAGPVQYHHARWLGDRDTVSGITIGRLLVDVPTRLHDPDRVRAEAELAARGGGRPTRAILQESDIDAAIDQAIELARIRTKVTS
ncbi:MAG: hypothetical protein MUE36_05795 [Acidimicrobiales bacterium]|jgi:hypothetical protein|nr:hypothetical protein [Acidimicrobiales bacterium]